MPAIDDDDRPKKKIVHEIGQDLTLLSVGELTERVALLKEEIARLEADIGEQAGLEIGGRSVFQEMSDGAARQICLPRVNHKSRRAPILTLG